ncbi:MAG: ATP-binding protein [Nibricoccus sp.]
MRWEDDVTRGIVDKLGEQCELIITQLDVQRYSVLGREKKMLEIMSNRVKMSRPVLVIAVDDFAYRYVLENRDEFEAGTPIVFGGVNFWQEEQPRGVTGVVESIDFGNTFDLMSQLQPEAKRWVIVNDQSGTGQANRKAFERVRPELLSRFGSREILWLGDGTYAETEARLAKLDPKRDAVLLLTWNTDGTGLARSYEASVRRAREICPAPLYGMWGFYFGNGIVGGSLIDGQIHGAEIGDIARRVLSGESPESIPVVTQCRTTLKIDYREFQRLGLNKKLIPKNAEVHHRTLSVWEQYAAAIIVIAVVIGLQATTITWLIIVIQRRRQARARLRESEARLRHTLDSLEEAVIVTDPRNHITRINPAAEKLTGVQNADALTQPLHAILPLQDLQNGLPLVLPTLLSLQQEQASRTIRARLKSREGPEYIVVHSAAPILDDEGAEQGMVMVLRNVTEQHRLEEQLYQAQKMESIGQLAGGIAHDFNNILAVIVGHGELLREQLQNQPAALEDLQMLLRGAQRATDLVQQILAFSRKTKHEMTPLHLQTVVKEALKFLRSTVPTSIEIAPRISADLPLILGDLTQIHQVIMNLCTNAAHAMKGSSMGRLEVRLESIHANTEFALMHPGLREGEYVRLSVSDTGHGMDEATIKRIFEPFFTTKAHGEGTGLGLSVVHGIVKAHNGGIFVYSHPGEGTIFHIYLPALSISKTTEEAASTAVPTGNGEHILFVDDEPAIVVAARRMIEGLGYRITVFQDPLLALDHLRKHAAEFDLIVSDLTMPGASGIVLSDEVRRIRPDLPIILTTGFAAELTEADIKNRGIHQLLLKPFTTPTIARALHAVLQNKSA